MLAAACAKFALTSAPSMYARGRESLEGLPIFVNTWDETAPHAAYFTINDAITDGPRIAEAVRRGYLVRTRADVDTYEARNNDASRLEAALNSGAHFISTDYLEPRRDFSPYAARLPEGGAARCNPVRAPSPAGC